MKLLEMQQYLTQLQSEMPTSDVDPAVLMKLAELVSIMQLSIPLDELDPGKIDLMNNLYKVLCNPEEYYSYCRQEQILDKSEGSAFRKAYPEFYKMFSEIYIDKFHEMDYQEQINFQKCFDIVQDNSQLLQLCMPVITYIHQQGQQV